jgi:endonuclease YncB( thermonuclease family)
LCEDAKLELFGRLWESVGVSPAAGESDQYGRLLAHLHDSDGSWIKGAMLCFRWARAYSLPDNRLLVHEILTLERQARPLKLEIWATLFYRIRHECNFRCDIDTLQLVEGQVRNIATVK